MMKQKNHIISQKKAMKLFHMNNTFRMFFCPLIVFAVLSAAAFAAEKPLLDVDFGSTSWRELMPEHKGDIATDGNVLRLTPKSVVKTALLPVRKGDNITVSLEASCKDIIPVDGASSVVCGVIRLYGKTQSEYAVHTICQIKGTSDWKKYALKLVADERCAFIGVELANDGKHGDVYYRDLKISLRDDMIELIGDSGFEDNLGVNYWFFRNSGIDWDGFKFLKDPGKAELDTKIFATGKKSLRLSGGAITLVSKTFPYNGEKMIISGWFRGDGIKAGDGKPSWAGAGIQIVGMNEKGIEFCHKDLAILIEPTTWSFRQSEFSFAGSVKKFQVCLRMFEGAQGTLWLDEVRLRSQPKELRPFDPKKAVVSLDLSKPESRDINYKAWAGVDGLAADWLLSPDVQQCFPYLKDAGFEYIRLREMSNMLKIYPNDNKDGTPAYNWDKFDQLFDLLVSGYGFTPIITLGTTPPALDKPGSRKENYTNELLPNDLKKWSAYTQAIFEHAIHRYGKEEVAKWMWEIWNEPQLPSKAVGSLEEFGDLVIETFRAKERVDEKYGIHILLGLTSGGTCDEYLVQRLKAAGKHHLIEHRSEHYYAGEDTSVNIIKAAIAEAKAFKKSTPGLKDYPIGCTEWNCTGQFRTRPNTAWNAPFAIKMVKIFLDSGLDYATYFDLVDHPSCQTTEPIFEQKDFGLFTRPNDCNTHRIYKPIPKPVYNAFLFLNELKGGKRIPLNSSNDPVDGIAVTMPDGSIRLLLASYDDDTTRQPYVTNVNIEINGIPQDAKYQCTRLWAADEKYGNSYGEWIKLGKPTVTDVNACNKILEASKYGVLPSPSISVKGGKAELTLQLPSPGIRLIEIKPEK